MPPRTEVLGDEPIRGQKALGVARGRESVHPPRNLLRHIVEHPILPVIGPADKVCWVLAPHGMPEKAWNRVCTLVMKGAARSRWLAQEIGVYGVFYGIVPPWKGENALGG